MIISTAELEKYFGKEATPAKMKEQIMTLLDEWKEKQPPELAKAPKKDGAGQVTTSRHFVPRALPSASWLWWYISPVAACFFVQPGAGCQGCIAPPFYGGLPLTVCPGCAISPASGGVYPPEPPPFP